MLQPKFTMSMLAGAFAFSLGLALAAETATTPPQVYGSQLMTLQERATMRTKMRAAKTPEERATLRAEHHKLMQQRARELGVELPNTPPAGGMGPGGMGPGGMGPGGGMHTSPGGGR